MIRRMHHIAYLSYIIEKHRGAAVQKAVELRSKTRVYGGDTLYRAAYCCGQL